MRLATVTLLTMTSVLTTVALAQDGGGHSGPKLPTTLPQPAPTPTLPTAPQLKVSQTKLR